MDSDAALGANVDPYNSSCRRVKESASYDTQLDRRSVTFDPSSRVLLPSF